MTFNLSSDLNQYIRVKIGEAKSKEEEDKYVKEDIKKIKKEITKTNLQEKEIWEIILRIIYAEMLGHNTDFTHSFIVNNIQHKSYKVKRIAYLACIIIIEEDSPFRIMMVASLQRDLENSCLYNKIIALNTLNKILCPLNASAFIEMIKKIVNNPQVVIRKKSLLVVIKIEEILPGSIEDFEEIIEKGLKDKEASVMMAVLPFYYKEIKKNPEKYKNKLFIFMEIFQQILERKLSTDYNYDNHPAPWSIIRILQIFKFLCQNDKTRSEEVYKSLRVYIKSFTILQTDVDIALLFQTAMCLIQIYPNKELINITLEKIEAIRMNGFVKESNTTYLMLKLISQLVEVDKKYTESYQMLLLSCLDSQDETIKHLTINILFKNINSNNIELVVKQIKLFLQKDSDVNFKRIIIKKLNNVIEQKAPNPVWYLNNAINIFQQGPKFIDNQILNSVILNIKEILSYEENHLVTKFLEIFRDFIQNNNLNEFFVALFFWFLGEYFELIEEFFPDDNFIQLLKYLLKDNIKKNFIYSYIFNGLQKINMKTSNQTIRSSIKGIFDFHKKSECTESQIRLEEYTSLKPKTAEIFKIDQLDTSFSFLNEFVQKNLQKSGKTYNKNYKSKQRRRSSSDLVIKYTEEQIQNNLKKNMIGSDKIFKYKGKAKWSQTGFKKEEINKTNLFGENKKEFKFKFGSENEEIGKVTGVNATQKNEKLKKKKRKKQKKKKLGIKNKMAASLFGGGELNLSKKEGSNSLFKNNKVLSGGKKEQKKQENPDFLNMNNDQPQPQLKEDIDFFGLDQDRKKEDKLLLEPFSITLERYEKLWEDMEESSYSFECQKNKSFSEYQTLIKELGFEIVDTMEEEIVCAAQKMNKPILLYLSVEAEKTIDLIIRGDKNISKSIKKSIE